MPEPQPIRCSQCGLNAADVSSLADYWAEQGDRPINPICCEVALSEPQCDLCRCVCDHPIQTPDGWFCSTQCAQEAHHNAA